MKTSTVNYWATLILLLAIAIVPAGCKDDDPVSATPSTTVHEELVSVWRAVSATVDGEPVIMIDFFDLPENAAFFHLTISEDATYRVEVLDVGFQVLQYENGTMVSSGRTFIMTKTSENGVAVVPSEIVAAGIYDVTGVTLTFTIVDGDSTIVLVFSNLLT